MDKFIPLIEELSKDLKPVKRKSWGIPCLVWCGLFVLLLSINYLLSNLFKTENKNFFELIFQPIFILGLLTFLSSFLYVIFSSLPGRNYLLWKKASYLFFISWGLIIIYNVISQGDLFFDFDDFLHCGIGTFLITFFLIGIIFYFTRKRYIISLNAVWIGGIITSSITSTLCIGFFCQTDSYSHIFYAHFLPVLFLFFLVHIVVFIKNKYL